MKRVGLLRFDGINIKVVMGKAPGQRGEAVFVPEYPDHASEVAERYASWGFRSGIEVYDKKAHENPFKHGDAYFDRSAIHFAYLVHLVTMGASPEKQFETVYKAVFRAVCKSNQMPYTRVEHIAVSLDLGADALTPEQNARAIIGAVDAFSRVCGYAIVKEVIICVDNAEAMDAVEKVLAEDSYRGFGTQEGQAPFDPDKWVVEDEGCSFCNFDD